MLYTCISGVDCEIIDYITCARRQTFTVCADSGCVADLLVTDVNGEWRVRNWFAMLQNSNEMIACLAGCECNSWKIIISKL